jgi:DNA repair protein RadA/Sms
VRSIKNRFGSTSEVGIFEMTEEGFVESNPVHLFLTRAPGDAAGAGTAAGLGRPAAREAGCCVAVTVEGSRPLCVEVQALCAASTFQFPRHRAVGVTMDRLFLLLAVLTRHTPLRFYAQDVLINVVGGLRIWDPTADVAVAMAIASSAVGEGVPADAVFLGEVGLGGELRNTPRLAQRLAAAAQLGFRTAYVPAAAPGARSRDGRHDSGEGDVPAAHHPRGGGAAPGLPLHVVRVRTLAEVVTHVFGANVRQRIAQARAARRAGDGPAAGRREDHGQHT